MRQDHHHEDDRRAAASHGGRHPLRRRFDSQHQARGTRRGDGVPELSLVPLHEHRRQHRLRPQDAQGEQKRDQIAGPGHARPGPAPRLRGPKAQPALGRTAAAHRSGPRADRRAQRVALGRAPLQPRRSPPRRDARPDPKDPDRDGDHHRLRHPRPGRGRGAGRQGGAPVRRSPPAVRRSRLLLRDTQHRRDRHLLRRHQLHPGQVPKRRR